MKLMQLAERESTQLWKGDVLVVGAGVAGITAALRAAGQGKRTCLVEPGPTLGTETSRRWQNRLPDGAVVTVTVGEAELVRATLRSALRRNARRRSRARLRPVPAGGGA